MGAKGRNPPRCRRCAVDVVAGPTSTPLRAGQHTPYPSSEPTALGRNNRRLSNPTAASGCVRTGDSCLRSRPRVSRKCGPGTDRARTCPDRPPLPRRQRPRAGPLIVRRQRVETPLPPRPFWPPRQGGVSRGSKHREARLRRAGSPQRRGGSAGGPTLPRSERSERSVTPIGNRTTPRRSQKPQAATQICTAIFESYVHRDGVI